MKKFLSLVLALIMTMSLVTVSAGAKDFTDDDKVTYEEAVSVMSSVKVLDGYADGSFNPQGGLTRGAAAKIICNLILGPTTAAELHADTAPYKDVPVDHTFAGYIAYCAKEGIISGYADGSFRPAAPLTGYAFMKMLLGALGYDQIAEGYTGANWSINVAKQALGIGLNKGLKTEFSGIKTVTREEAALYAFNTLQSTMVEYSEKTTVNVGGAQVTLSGNAQDVEWGTATLNDGNIKKDGFVQFAEKHFPKLVKKATQDDFARPAYTWVNNKVELGTYVDWNSMVAEYTKGIKGKDVYEDIGGAAAKDFTVSAYLDGFKVKNYNVEAVKAKTTFTKADEYSKAVAGHIYKKSDESLQDSGKGVLTQIFVNTDKGEVIITFINTWLAEVTADYNEKTEKLPLKAFTDYSPKTPPTAAVTNTITTAYNAILDEVANVADFEKEDMVRITVADGVVKSVEEAEVMSDVTISSYSADPADDNTTPAKMSSITADGSKIDAAKMAFEDATKLFNYALNQLKDKTYDVYMDAYGYVLGLRAVKAADNYVFVVGYEAKNTVLAASIDKATIINIDGTMDTVDIKDDDLDNAGKTKLGLNDANDYKNGAVNAWFTYTVDKNDVYKLEKLVEKQFHETQNEIATNSHPAGANITDATDGTISGLYATLEGNNYAANRAPVVAVGNEKSVYITVKADCKYVQDGSITKVNGVSTGIKNTNIRVVGYKDPAAQTNVTGAYVMYNDKGYVTYAVVLGRNAGNSANLVYLTSGIAREHFDDPDLGETYWVYDCIRDGELTTIKSLVTYSDGNKNNDLVEGVLYEALFDANGYVTDITTKNELTKINSTTHKAEGYQYQEIDTTAGDNVTALQIVGAALHLITNTDDQYIVLADNCKFFVNSKATDKKYQEVGNADTMLTYLGKPIDSETVATGTVPNAGVTGYNFTGVLAAICDSNGYATTLILLDTYTNNDDAAVSYKPTTNTNKYEASLAFNTSSDKMELTVAKKGGAALEDGTEYAWEIEAVNTTSGYTYVAAKGDETNSDSIEVYKASGIIRYQATITFADGVVVTAPIMG